MLAMTVGAWLATIAGPRDVFLYLSLATAVSICLAFGLNDFGQERRIKRPMVRDKIFPKPDSLDLLIFWMGAGIDGVFTVSISLMWAQYLSTEVAILIGGSILAGRRLSEMLIAPCAGMIADRFGIRYAIVFSDCYDDCGIWVHWCRTINAWIYFPCDITRCIRNPISRCGCTYLSKRENQSISAQSNMA